MGHDLIDANVATGWQDYGCFAVASRMFQRAAPRMIARGTASGGPVAQAFVLGGLASRHMEEAAAMAIEVLGTMTLLEIASAVVGTVGAAHAMVPTGESGFLFDAGEATYPTEQNDKFGQFVRDDHYINRVALRFVADGYIWDTDIDIALRGYFSQDAGDLVKFHDDPDNVAANRFMKDVGFYPAVGSDRITSSLLRVVLDPDGSVGGSPDNPYLIWQVSGRFDPYGFGDADFFFRLCINSWGNLWIEDVNAPGMSVQYSDEMAQVTLNQ